MKIGTELLDDVHKYAQDSSNPTSFEATKKLKTKTISSSKEKVGGVLMKFCMCSMIQPGAPKASTEAEVNVLKTGVYV